VASQRRRTSSKGVSVHPAAPPASNTITPPHGMLGAGGRGSKESLELEEEEEEERGELHLNASLGQPSTSPSSTSSSPTQQHHHVRGSSASASGRVGNHHHGNHHHGEPPPQRRGRRRAPPAAGANQQHHTLTVAGGTGHHGHHLSQPLLQTSVSAHNIRSWGEGGAGEGGGGGGVGGGGGGGGGMGGDQPASVGGSGAPSRSQGSLDLESSTREAEDGGWFPKDNMFSFQTATTTMQANFRKHLRMVGSKRMKAQSGDLQASCSTLDEGGCDERLDWEEEREMERLACEGDDFIPPKIMLISSKVPKAEYVPTILRRDDPSIIPILYDHEHATFDDILEEIDKKLTAYRRGCKFWRMLIFCQVEKEEDMSQFWRRLSRFMSKLNPEPNMIHIMGCYVLGNPNGEKLFQELKNLMRPYSVEFRSPLELSSQGKEMIEGYFDFRLYRLWKTRQHSKLMDYEDLL
ncbi:hypothetical protein CRUP_029313, partial [Coryphaenoides rupestris]